MNTQRKSALLAQASKSFSNYLGDDRQNFPSRFSGMAGNGANVSPEMMTLVVNISNTDQSFSLAAPLFSAFENIAVPFNGVTDTITGNTAQVGRGIIITWTRYSDAEIKARSINNPFVIRGLRYTFGDDTQLSNQWTRRFKQGSQISTDIYEPEIYRDLSNNISTTLDDPSFFQLVSGETTIFVLLSAATNSTTPRRVKVVFNVGEQVQAADILKGQNAVQIFGAR